MKSYRKHLITACIFLNLAPVFVSCENAVEIQQLQIDKNKLISINKYMVDKDFDIIRHFIRRKSWQMSFSGKGYYSEILDAGNKLKIQSQNTVVCNYVLSLLDGTVCYEKHNTVFTVDRTEEISGLHDAVKLLGEGGKARFIFPSHLAHGLQGDFNKIPPRSILICQIQILSVK